MPFTKVSDQIKSFRNFSFYLSFYLNLISTRKHVEYKFSDCGSRSYGS